MRRKNRLGLTGPFQGGVWRKAGFALKKTWVEARMFLRGPLPDENAPPYPVSILADTTGWSSMQAGGNLDEGLMVLQSE